MKPLTPTQFWDLAVPEPNTGCWLWTRGTTPKGYGKTRWGGGNMRAHRVAWLLANGAIGDMCVLHRCDTPACINPAHLFLGTPADNARDRDRKGRTGRPMGGARLAVADVKAIKKVCKSGTDGAVARRYGVVPETIRRIRIGAAWRHI